MRSLSVARDLQRRRARERSSQFLAEGVRCVEELMASPLTLRSVLVSPGISETTRGEELLQLVRTSAAERRFHVDEVTESEMASVSGTERSQGILAIADRPERSFESIAPQDLVLILDAVQDPGNVGTILRTAQAFGVSATIALPGTADLWNPKVVRSAMGALFTHNAFHASTEDTLAFLAGIAMPIWATSAAGERIGQRAAKRSGDSGLAIVVGNEAAGVSRELVAAATCTVAIPILGVESLNVAVATGVLLYAVTTA